MTTPVPSADDAVVVRGAEVETLGHPALVTVGLLADAADTNGALSVVRVTLADGVDGATPHHHAHSAELFFMLSGQAQVLVGDHVLDAREGDLVVVPDHLPHAFGAAAGLPADLLIVLTPGIDRFEYFRILERVALGKVAADELTHAQERFDTWFLDSAVWDRERNRGTTG
jgi:mannose-6-phosphate isomerase-like protein (cupin superfamily)